MEFKLWSIGTGNILEPGLKNKDELAVCKNEIISVVLLVESPFCLAKNKNVYYKHKFFII